MTFGGHFRIVQEAERSRARSTGRGKSGLHRRWEALAMAASGNSFRAKPADSVRGANVTLEERRAKSQPEDDDDRISPFFSEERSTNVPSTRPGSLRAAAARDIAVKPFSEGEERGPQSGAGRPRNTNAVPTASPAVSTQQFKDEGRNS